MPSSSHGGKLAHRKTAKKWIRTKADERAVREGCYYDPEPARFVIDFIETFCCLSKGEYAGKQIKLIPWQIDLIHQLYGWRRADGRRRFRTAYVEIPKKNGKSGLVSALALYHLIADGEPGAHIYINACDKKQACIVFEESLHMVQSSKYLQRILDPVPSAKHILHPASKSKLVANSADAPNKDGFDASVTIFDELHRQPNDKLWDVFRRAGKARRQPLLLSITTAGYDRSSICYRQHDYSKKILNGVLDDTTHFAMIFAADSDDDIQSPKTWRKANPSLGYTLSEEDFAIEVQQALECPTDMNSFLRFSLNIWTQSETRYISRPKWDACGVEPIDKEALRWSRCWGGGDLASTQDTTSFVLLFEDGSVLPHFWLPRAKIEKKSDRDRSMYLAWESAGYLTLTEGDRVDYEVVRKEIGEMCAGYDVQSMAFDPHNATQICSQLQQDGFAVEYMRQGFISMNAPTKELERLVHRGEIKHGGNPVLTWMNDNCSVITDHAENIKLIKASESQKIDGMIALVMAVAMRMTAIGSTQQWGAFTLDLDKDG